MKSLSRCIAAALLILLLVPAAFGAEPKIRIAIWDFENHTENRWWFYNDLGPAARNHIDTAFSENPTLYDKFSVIEREKLDMVMQEQGLSTSGALDQQTAAKVGQILGIRYILTGGIDSFAINTTKGGLRGIGGKMTKADATINMRFIDTTTAERMVSISGEGNVKKGGGFFKGASLSRENEWGIASEAIEQASMKVVEEFVNNPAYMDRLSAGGGAAAGAEGKIIKVEGNRAWINMGSFSGIQMGDSFEVLSVGEPLVDPDTGQVLGVDETRTGQGKVVEVEERFAIIEVSGEAAASSIVRKN